jgi:hypothetical protein
MKKNAFGEPILQPGDDIGAAFMDAFDTDIDATLTAWDIEEDDLFGWSCTIRDEEDNEIQVHDFASEDELREYLTTARVEIA